MVDLPVDINNSMKSGEAAHVKLTGLLDGVGEVALADVQFNMRTAKNVRLLTCLLISIACINEVLKRKLVRCTS